MVYSPHEETAEPAAPHAGGRAQLWDRSCSSQQLPAQALLLFFVFETRTDKGVWPFILCAHHCTEQHSLAPACPEHMGWQFSPWCPCAFLCGFKGNKPPTKLLILYLAYQKLPFSFIASKGVPALAAPYPYTISGVCRWCSSWTGSAAMVCSSAPSVLKSLITLCKTIHPLGYIAWSHPPCSHLLFLKPGSTPWERKMLPRASHPVTLVLRVLSGLAVEALTPTWSCTRQHPEGCSRC